MKFLKNWIFWGLALSLLGIISGYIFVHSYELGICYANLDTNTFDSSCHNRLLHIGDMFFFSSIALAIVFLILLFAPRAVSAWRKFAIWYVPLAAVIIGWPEGDPGSWNIGPTTEQTALWLGVAYVVVSALIVVRVIFFKHKTTST